LDASQGVSIPNDTWSGELGLCPDWSQSPPGDDCLEIVSSCVLARVNKEGHRVIISVRGEPKELFPLQASVPVQKELRNHDMVQSLIDQDCMGYQPLPATGDATRNCGWWPLQVGRCQASQMVTVCPSDSATMLRVCKGLYGCDDGEVSTEEYHGPL